MKSLKQLCKPRESVFDRSRRHVVLDLTDLVQDKIDPDHFFRENWRTDGTKGLLREAFSPLRRGLPTRRLCALPGHGRPPGLI